jgi:alpha-methylacyl-CoA racemase
LRTSDDRRKGERLPLGGVRVPTLAVSAALSLFFGRERGRGAGYEQVDLSGAARFFSGPLRWGTTAPDGVLGGGFAGYGLYRAQEGYVPLAVLEKHFWERLRGELGIVGEEREGDGRRGLERVFRTRTARQWEEWPQNANSRWPRSGT